MAVGVLRRRRWGCLKRLWAIPSTRAEGSRARDKINGQCRAEQGQDEVQPDALLGPVVPGNLLFA